MKKETRFLVEDLVALFNLTGVELDIRLDIRNVNIVEYFNKVESRRNNVSVSIDVLEKNYVCISVNRIVREYDVVRMYIPCKLLGYKRAGKARKGGIYKRALKLMEGWSYD